MRRGWGTCGDGNKTVSSVLRLLSSDSSYLLWSAELQDARLLGYDGALVLRREARHQLGHKPAGLLGVEITHFLGNINNAGEDLVVTLLITFLQSAAGSTDLDGKLLTGGVSHELTGLLLHILGAAGGLVHSLTDLLSLAVTNLLYRFVTFPHSLVESLLFEGDGTSLLKVLLADLLLCRLKLGDVGVVTLLHVLVSALQDWLLLQGGHLLLLLHTAQAGLRVLHAAAEVEASLDLLLSPGPSQLLGVQPDKVSGGEGDGEGCCEG